jgi:dipeptidase E
MNNANLLLLSSSRVKQSAYLEHALPMIKQHLQGVSQLLFIPYAAVSLDYDEYTQKVQQALGALNVEVKGIHTSADPVAAIKSAEAIVIGGGNTFHLLHQLYLHQLLAPIRERVAQGMPYIGWSAGSNIAGLSIKTTNDMPVIEPPSFDALGLVNFQLNPHYTDYNAPGHNGETRAERLAEFMVLHPDTPIVAIIEGTALTLCKQALRLIGPEHGYIFKDGQKTTMTTQSNLDYLLVKGT